MLHLKDLYLEKNLMFVNPIIKIISNEITDDKNYLFNSINIINKKCSNSAVVAAHFYINIKQSSNPRLKIKEYFNL